MFPQHLVRFLCVELLLRMVKCAVVAFPLLTLVHSYSLNLTLVIGTLTKFAEIFPQQDGLELKLLVCIATVDRALLKHHMPRDDRSLLTWV